ncbi:hypothetical protein CONLIGDRAFT_683585 [Coniochaeta ligniaria NRRL 30616]|uniref:Uncharacterized protein n=1 Tax=Coniochaeta ligniaria NRRL 30616 TaxID=1408157 RepID=A0A1J7JA18_9PEZI|nr:hypothetical protein CONLIGDRAFT_683585 [Coniochaeta ligniaria NRRL 30616]
MGVSIFERIQAKIEIFRLEQRYTRRRHRRSTFVSNAVYVDGEYIYNTPNTTGSSTNTNSTSQTSERSSAPSPSPEAAAAKERKKLNRWSSMPGFGSMSKATPARPSSRRWESERRNSLSETSRDL